MQAQGGSYAYICKNNNWMQWDNLNVFYLSPAYNFSNVVVLNNSTFCSAYDLRGSIRAEVANRSFPVFPSLYLKSNVLIESGNGTSDSPYILKLDA